MSRITAVAIVLVLFACSTHVKAQLISDFITNDIGPISGGDPMPDNLFDTSLLFQGLTIGGSPTLSAVWQQTVFISSSGNTTVGSIPGPLPGGQLQTQIQVTETDSQMLFYEWPTDFTFVAGGDPILFSQFNMGGGGGPMVLNLVDADPNLVGNQPFLNDLSPQVPLDPGTEIAVWQGSPIPVEIVALTLTGVQPVAVNTMVPFQFFGDDGTDTLDNAFGVFTGDWVLPLGPGVLLDSSGTGAGPFTPSPFLMNWPVLPQTRWKGHPGGWVQVVVSSTPLPGPAGIFHPGGGIPLPGAATMGMAGLCGVGLTRRPRSKTNAA